MPKNNQKRNNKTLKRGVTTRSKNISRYSLRRKPLSRRIQRFAMPMYYTPPSLIAPRKRLHHIPRARYGVYPHRTFYSVPPRTRRPTYLEHNRNQNVSKISSASTKTYLGKLSNDAMGEIKSGKTMPEGYIIMNDGSVYRDRTAERSAAGQIARFVGGRHDFALLS